MEASSVTILSCVLLLFCGATVDAQTKSLFFSRYSSTQSNDTTFPTSSTAVSAASSNSVSPTDSSGWHSVTSISKLTGPTKRHIAPRPPPRFPLTYDGLFRRRRSVVPSDAQSNQHSRIKRRNGDSRIAQKKDGPNLVRRTHDVGSVKEMGLTNNKNDVDGQSTDPFQGSIYSNQMRPNSYQNVLDPQHPNVPLRNSFGNHAIYKGNNLRYSPELKRHRRKKRESQKMNRNTRQSPKNPCFNCSLRSANVIRSEIPHAQDIHYGKITPKYGNSISLKYYTSKNTRKNEDPDALENYSSLTPRENAAKLKPFALRHVFHVREVGYGKSPPAIQIQASSAAFNSLDPNEAHSFHNAAHHAFHRSQNNHAPQGHGGIRVPHDPHPAVKYPNVQVGEFNKPHEIHRGHPTESTTQAYLSYKRHALHPNRMNIAKKNRRKRDRRGYSRSIYAKNADHVKQGRKIKKKTHSEGSRKARKSLRLRKRRKGSFVPRASGAGKVFPTSVSSRSIQSAVNDHSVTNV